MIQGQNSKIRMKTSLLKSLLAMPGTMLVTGHISHAATKASEKPNILYIMTDQQRWDALGYSGNSVIRTPHLDRLARSGVWFSSVSQSAPRSSCRAGPYPG